MPLHPPRVLLHPARQSLRRFCVGDGYYPPTQGPIGPSNVGKTKVDTIRKQIQVSKSACMVGKMCVRSMTVFCTLQFTPICRMASKSNYLHTTLLITDFLDIPYIYIKWMLLFREFHSPDVGHVQAVVEAPVAN